MFNLNIAKYDMFNLNQINNDILLNINKNIDYFDKFINKYKNILFICGDYPNYGGAATNCDHLENYYKNKGHNTYSYYHDYKKIDINNINFKPDVIILKSFIKINLKDKFKCPIIYLIGGIYKNELDKYYFDIHKKEEQDKYINISVINQIKNSDYSFSNSSHTQEILKKYYNLDTGLFYSSFVQFKDKNGIIDDNFVNRKYDYGLIVSNFDRKIKNIDKSIDFLKNKKNVILIGKNSNKYISYGFECVDLINNNEMINYYKNIKYIVQDSFYESCSNVKIEGLFYGCEMYFDSITLISENTNGFGGFGTLAYQFFNLLTNYNIDTKLLYLNISNEEYESINKLNEPRIKGYYLNNYYPFLNSIFYNIKNNNYDENKINKFKEFYIENFDKKTKIICLTPLSLSLISLIFPYKNIIYYCGSMMIDYDKLNYKKSIFEQPNLFKYTDNFSNILNNIKTYGTSKLSCNYINHTTNNITEMLSCPFIVKKNIDFNIKKKYDLIFISSDITRKDKNFDLAYKIFKIYPNLNKIIIGKNSNNIKLPNCETYEFLSNNDVLLKLNETKICLITSIKDMGPGVFFESIQNLCIPLISYNCGYSYNYKYTLSFDFDEWKNKIDELMINDIFDYKYFSNILKETNISKSVFLNTINNNYSIYDKYIVLIYNNFNNNYQIEYIKSSFKNICIINNFNDIKNIDVPKNTKIILIDNSILIYNWIYINDRNLQCYNLIKESYDNFINLFPVKNDDDTYIYVFEYKDIELFEYYFENKSKFIYNINLYNIHYHDKKYGININNNLILNKNIENSFGILFINQLKDNIFSKYVKNIQSNIRSNTYIFILYGNNIPVSILDDSFKNVFYINESEIISIINNYNIKTLYIPYLPLEFINNIQIIDNIFNNHKINKFIFIGGIISHMLKYTILYDNFNVITVGTKYKEYFKNKNITQIPIWNYETIFEIKKITNNINQRLNYKRKYKFAIIGRVSIEKNIIFCIEAFHKFITNYNHDDFELYIIGNINSNTDIMKKINNYILINKLEKNIILKKWMSTEDLIKFCIKNIDFNILTSTNEGLSGVVLECMTVGIPSITGNICCVNDVIINNYNGFFFEYENYNNILFNKIHTSPTFINTEIYKHNDKNKKNFIEIINKCCNLTDVQYLQITNNCYNYIQNIYINKMNENYNDIFTLNNKLYSILFNSSKNNNSKSSINFLTNDNIIINKEFNINLLLDNLYDIQKKAKYIILINDDYSFVSEYKYLLTEYYDKKILPQIIDTNYMCYFFIVQNIYYGNTYDLGIYNINKLICYIEQIYNKDLNLKFIDFEQSIKNNLNNFILINTYIAFQNIEDIIPDFNYSKYLYYYNVLFKKYNITSINDIQYIFKDSKINLNDSEINLNDLIEKINKFEIINTEYNKNYKINKIITFWEKKLFNYFLNIDDFKINNQFIIGFVYAHYISNCNFERKIFYYINKLNSVGIKCCLIIGNNNINRLRIPFNYCFENIIFLPNFNYDNIFKKIKYYNIKNLYFIDGLFNCLSFTEYCKLSDKNNINLILSGLGGFVNIISNKDYLNLFNNIITNSPAHKSILNNDKIKVHQFYDVRPIKNIFYKKTLDRKISYIGRFYKEKQCKLLYNVFELLSTKYNDYYFYFYGIGDELNDYKDTDNIKIIKKWNNYEEVCNIIKQSDFIIQSSISEGNPNIIWESLKESIPVICSNIYGNNSIIIENYNGYLFDLEGYDEIKNNIELSYDNILDKLSSKINKTILNIIRKIEHVIKIDINDYNNLQLNCFNTYHQYSQVEYNLNIKELFNL